MKRQNNLFEKIVSFENVLKASKRQGVGKDTRHPPQDSNTTSKVVS